LVQKEAVCVECGKTFTYVTAGGGTSTGKLCSAECRWKRKRQRIYEQRQRWRAAPVPDHVHGTANGYVSYGCRCELCSAANAAVQQKHRQRKKTGD
jgi:hypothetical protein